MADGYTRRSATDVDMQPVAISSVNLAERKAVCLTRAKTAITVDCAFSTGDTTVVPAVGEQWYVTRIDTVWMLYGRIPYNDPTLLVEPVEGQVSVGSGRGPIELHGDSVNAHGPVVLDTVRPSAVTAGQGAMVYDTTLHKPIWSDGVVWRDAMGGTV